MGHNIERNRYRSKSLSGSEFPTWVPVVNANINLFKRVTKMAEAKALIWVLNFIGFPTAVLGWLLNIMPDTKNTVMAWVIGTIGALFLAARLVVYCITSYQNIKIRNYEIKMKEREYDGG